jgi:hypothetical protein
MIADGGVSPGRSTNMSQMYGYPGGMVGGSIGMVGAAPFGSSVNGGYGMLGGAMLGGAMVGGATFGSVNGGGFTPSASPAPMMSPIMGAMPGMVSAIPVCTENLYSLR